MIPLTNFDLFLFIEILVKLTLVTHFIRYIITFALPQEFRNYFDNYARGIRNRSISYSDGYFPNTKNFEVVMLSRVIIPLLFMLTINTYLDFLLVSYVFGRYLLVSYFFYFIKLFFFLNIAPTLDDLDLLYNANGFSRIVFFLKILLIFNMYNSLTPLAVSFIIIFPISDFLDVQNYSVKEIIEPHPSWDFV
ncbi:MAG: hypothetical protein HeimC2_21650 [Candidatus Heimdallarchaeota archaeon LC_2]|nr:MAG: hypothetical protein HeimC2_21650 [Candidatus Heimdallarchaeota archaeon LC_2]